MPQESTVIRLAIPAAPEFLRLARLAAADVASRAGFSFEDIEDLRIGVDELCHLLMTPGAEADHLQLTFTLEGDAVAVEGEGPPGANHVAVIQSDLSRTIVTAVADEHEVHQDGEVLRFRLLKRVPTS
ncbi:MAG TPA: ATP-binding protein [Acidimicrobiia bacterium]|nr:ATP-binding protein [Acidimicrobiia bacterium]